MIPSLFHDNLTMHEDVSISVDDEFREVVDDERVRKLVRSVLEAEGVAPPYQVGLVFTDSDTVRELNRDYRGLDEPTDVLAFYMLPGKGEDQFFAQPPDGITRLGEVIISCPRAEEQAREQGHSTERELTLLVIHGILHLLDYDHEDAEDEAEMRAGEKEHLERWST